MNRYLHKLIVVGDKLLIKPADDEEQTKSGLFLPPGVTEKEKVQKGIVLKAGPGYPIPAIDEDEPWKENRGNVRYIPLQARERDTVLYLRKDAFEIEYEGDKLLIIPQSAVLLIEREDPIDFNRLLHDDE